MLHIIRRQPSHFGHTSSRWTMRSLLETCSWLRLKTTAGMWQMLKRLGIVYKRGRAYIHSPDRHYQQKLALIEQARLRAYYAPQRYAFWYLDEVTFYRQPTLAQAYEQQGACQPLARHSYRSNTCWRLVGALNALSGQVLYQGRSKIGRTCLSDFLATIHAASQDVETVYVVVDNWPVHFHPDVLARLQPQRFPFAPRLPGNWPTQPRTKAVQDNLSLQLLSLPTYASWLNPIEKLWRWLRQHLLHLHRLSGHWLALKQRVNLFLDQFKDGSLDLLRYTGLLPT